MNIYYVYAYLRKDGSPYYIGKGKGNRAYGNHGYHKPPKNRTRIVFLETCLTELGALALERRMIKWYGRKDAGTGILMNRTDGGEGYSGAVVSVETRNKLSAASIGQNNGMYGRKHSETVRLASRTRRAETNRARKWFNDGSESKFLLECPDGWTKGRINTHTSQYRWFNNGSINKYFIESPSNEWVLGFLKRDQT